MSVKFLLNADGGSLAFKKEVDVVNYRPETIDDPVWINVISGATPTAVPTSTSITTLSQDVGIYRNGMLRIVCSDPAATWSIQLYEGTAPTNRSGEVMAKMFNGDISGAGTTVIPVQVFMVKYLYVQVLTLSAGEMNIHWAPAEWEEVD